MELLHLLNIVIPILFWQTVKVYKSIAVVGAPTNNGVKHKPGSEFYQTASCLGWFLWLSLFWPAYRKASCRLSFSTNPNAQNMRNLKITLLITLILGMGSMYLVGATYKSPKKLRHVVAFKFKPEVSAAQMQQATQNFLALKKKVPQIMELEGGPDLTYQKKAGKYTHCFIVTVQDEQQLAVYGAHPNHRAFSKSVDPLLAEVMIVDYWTE
jgi:hypothetical protein